jgi:amino acid transporter
VHGLVPQPLSPRTVPPPPPIRYALFALALGAIFYALPIAVISAELACAAPYDGGLVAWVEEACGPRIGGHNVWWLWIS